MLFCLFFILSIFGISSFCKKRIYDIRFSSCNPRNLFACAATNFITCTHVGESEIFCGKKRERERAKRLTIREKERTRGTSSNPSNSSDVNARQSVTQGVALLRFVYFSRKALTQAARGSYRLRMTRVHTALHFLVPRPRSSLRRCSLIHRG